MTHSSNKILFLKNGKIVPATAPTGVGLDESPETVASSPRSVADDLLWRPFPMDALPKPFCGFVKAGSKTIGCDPSYLALPILAVAAAAIGNARKLRLKDGWDVPSILWCAIIGKHGSKKTPAICLALKPMLQNQNQRFVKYRKEKQEYKRAIRKWKRDLAGWNKDNSGDLPEKPQSPETRQVLVYPQLNTYAITQIHEENPKGLLLVCAEGLWDWRCGKDVGFWKNSYNGTSWKVNRKSGTRILIPSVAISIIGTIIPGQFMRNLKKEYFENGLAARFLMAYPPPTQEPCNEARIDPAIEKNYADVLEKLYDLEMETDEEGNPQPVIRHLSSEAKKIWEAWYNSHAVESEGVTADLAAAFSKIEELPARLALVFHEVKVATGEEINQALVSGETMQVAVELAKWFRYETNRIYARFSKTWEE